ncbi:quinone oxidoreductase-like protein 2 [Canis lupus dingo]|uniref:quinone oxidoreductase-like protein 2 n=1 Tax=Canis lupus dingo TaxID=286419 RepID=UPI00005A2C83|nr:quinone oxidoreductase-like protein 2 [Canis lupus dingo]
MKKECDMMLPLKSLRLFFDSLTQQLWQTCYVTLLNAENTEQWTREIVFSKKFEEQRKCQFVMQKGTQSVVNCSQGSLKEAVRKLVGSAGVNVVIDSEGGDVFLEALCSLVWEGRIVVVGFAGGTIASVPANLLLLKNVSAMGLYWRRYKKQNFPIISRILSSALQYCQQGRIQPHIEAVFKLEKVDDAFLHVIQRKSTDKVLISLK